MIVLRRPGGGTDRHRPPAPSEDPARALAPRLARLPGSDERARSRKRVERRIDSRDPPAQAGMRALTRGRRSPRKLARSFSAPSGCPSGSPRLRAPALRRPAPAGDDRARARVPAVARDRRRARRRSWTWSCRRGLLGLLEGLRAELGLALILISHDLSVLAETCDRIAVMYAGRIVETGPVKPVFSAPQHQYTKRLLESLPVIGGSRELATRIPRRPARPGRRALGLLVPAALSLRRRGLGAAPALREVAPGQSPACHFTPWERSPGHWSMRRSPNDAADGGPATSRSTHGAARALDGVSLEWRPRRDPRRQSGSRGAASRRWRARCWGWCQRGRQRRGTGGRSAAGASCGLGESR